MKDSVEMIQAVPKEQTQEHILEETMKEMPVTRGRIQECTGEETNDVPLSQVKEETTEAKIPPWSKSCPC